MSNSVVAKTTDSLYDLNEENSMLRLPVERQSEEIAFVGVYYNEGVSRLNNLFRLVRPWFKHMVIALQSPTADELNVTKSWTDEIIIHPKFGFCEASFSDVFNRVRELKAGWIFNLDGDELADQTLLASLSFAINDKDIQESDGARVPRRNTLQLSTGNVIPSLNESQARLLRSSCNRPAVPHADFTGTRKRPAAWHAYGAIRQHRTLEEFIKDQMSYFKSEDANPYSTIVSADYLASTYEYLVRYLGEKQAKYEYRAIGQVGIEALALISRFANPESSWEGWNGETV